MADSGCASRPWPRHCCRAAGLEVAHASEAWLHAPAVTELQENATTVRLLRSLGAPPSDVPARTCGRLWNVTKAMSRLQRECTARRANGTTTGASLHRWLWLAGGSTQRFVVHHIRALLLQDGFSWYRTRVRGRDLPKPSVLTLFCTHHYDDVDLWFRRDSTVLRVSYRFIAGLNLARWAAALADPDRHVDNLGAVTGTWPVLDEVHHTVLGCATSCQAAFGSRIVPDVAVLHSALWDLPSVVNMRYRLEVSRCQMGFAPELAERLFASRLEWVLRAARCELGRFGSRVVWRSAAFSDRRAASNGHFTGRYNNISHALVQRIGGLWLYDFAGLAASLPAHLQNLQDEPYPVHQGENVSERLARDLISAARGGATNPIDRTSSRLSRWMMTFDR